MFHLNRFVTRSPIVFNRLLTSKLTITSRNYASEVTKPTFSNQSNATNSSGSGSAAQLFDRLQQNPAITEAIEHLAKVIKLKTGVDLRNGEPPSMKMMQALATDLELQSAATDLMEQLKISGIEIDPRQAFQALKQMGGTSFHSNDSLFDEGKSKGEGEDEGEGDANGKGNK